jgi:hypothetical protein
VCGDAPTSAEKSLAGSPLLCQVSSRSRRCSGVKNRELFSSRDLIDPTAPQRADVRNLPIPRPSPNRNPPKRRSGRLLEPDAHPSREPSSAFPGLRQRASPERRYRTCGQPRELIPIVVCTGRLAQDTDQALGRHEVTELLHRPVRVVLLLCTLVKPPSSAGQRSRRNSRISGKSLDGGVPICKLHNVNYIFRPGRPTGCRKGSLWYRGSSTRSAR